MDHWTSYTLEADRDVPVGEINPRTLSVKRLTVADVLLLGSTDPAQRAYLKEQTTAEATKEQVDVLRPEIVSVIVRLCLGSRDYVNFNGQPEAQSALDALLGGEPVVASFWPVWTDEVLAASTQESQTAEDEVGN